MNPSISFCCNIKKSARHFCNVIFHCYHLVAVDSHRVSDESNVVTSRYLVILQSLFMKVKVSSHD